MDHEGHRGSQAHAEAAPVKYKGVEQITDHVHHAQRRSGQAEQLFPAIHDDHRTQHLDQHQRRDPDHVAVQVAEHLRVDLRFFSIETPQMAKSCRGKHAQPSRNSTEIAAVMAVVIEKIRFASSFFPSPISWEQTTWLPVERKPANNTSVPVKGPNRDTAE